MATYSSKKYPSGSVTSAQLADGTVVAVDLADGAVTSAKLNSTVDLSGKTVTYRSIVAGDIASGAITTAKVADANITPAKMANSGAELGMRNRIINGAMVIDQRNAGASVTPAPSGYTLDRWNSVNTQSSKLSVQQGALNGTLANFSYAMAITSLSAYTVGTSEQFSILQYIEGYNIADLAWGTANAKTVTLSFWAYSSLTGTFGGVLRNNSGTQASYPFSYSIPVANTWTQISITVAGPTSGTWLTTNGQGLAVSFSMGTGATLSGTAGTWSSNYYASATGAVSVVGTNGATFYLTGVQLEKGSTATTFDYRPYGTELQLCQRYCIAYNSTNDTNADRFFGYAYNTNTSLNSVQFPVTMRTTPAVTIANVTSFVLYTQNALSNPSGITLDGYTTKNANFTTTGTCTSGLGTILSFNNSGGPVSSIIFTAEL